MRLIKKKWKGKFELGRKNSCDQTRKLLGEIRKKKDDVRKERT